jgi:hypothetical protein
MTPLQLPPTLRSATLDDIPTIPELSNQVYSREHAKIVEGYTFAENISPDLGFKFYAEINIDNCQLWNLYKSLILQLPNEVRLIYGHIDENDQSFGTDSDKLDLINFLDKIQIELTQDCYLESGVIYHKDNLVQEVYISSAKYVKFWGVNEEAFRKIMNDYSLYQLDDINFIDEFPLVRTPLISTNPNVLSTEEVIQLIEERYRYDLSNE